MSKERNRVIDIISDKVKEIIENRYKNDIPKPPTFMISEMMVFDNNDDKCGTNYILTIIQSNNEYCTEYRQSDFINMHTDINQLVEQLYNRTM